MQRDGTTYATQPPTLFRVAVSGLQVQRIVRLHRVLEVDRIKFRKHIFRFGQLG